MNTATRLLAAAALSFAPGAARSETLIVSLSTGEVRIGSNFTGANVTVFGAIQRDAATVARPGAYDIAVVLRGPAETVVTRRKEEFLGVWINRSFATLAAVPAYYAVHSTGPLETMATEPVLDRLQLGTAHLALQPAAGSDPASAADFAAALRRLKSEAGLYVEAAPAVTVTEATIFQTAFELPAHIPVGRYMATVHLFSGGALLASADGALTVSKIGFEQFLFTAAQNQPLAYGATAVAIALLIGWLAGIIFRRD